jgi:hypothetical protein
MAMQCVRRHAATVRLLMLHTAVLLGYSPKGVLLGDNMRAFRVLAMATIMVAFAGCSLPPPCRSISEACTATTDCCGQLVCNSGLCASPSACRSSGQACAVTSDCCMGSTCVSGVCTAPSTKTVLSACQAWVDWVVTCPGVTATKQDGYAQCQTKICGACSTNTAACITAFDSCRDCYKVQHSSNCGNSNGPPLCSPAPTCNSAGEACTSTSCCTGLTCSAGKCAMPGSGCSGKACTTSAGCCTGYTCSRFNPRCVTASNLGLGEPCTSDTQCASGLCSDYCTKYCTTTSDCGSTAMYCIDTTIGFACVPYCKYNSDCAVYGGTNTCKMGVDSNGVTLPCCLG